MVFCIGLIEISVNRTNHIYLKIRFYFTHQTKYTKHIHNEIPYKLFRTFIADDGISVVEIVVRPVVEVVPVVSVVSVLLELCIGSRKP